MTEFDALMQYWTDPEVLVIPAGETDRIIEWLGQQTPNTWHKAVMTWNYDYGDKVLSWILQQDSCDRGTAARIFLDEGFGHWLGDKDLANDENHVCLIALDNWHRYTAGALKHGMTVSEADHSKVQDVADWPEYANLPLAEIIGYEGTRDARSKYGSEDGKIVIAFDYWLKEKGIEITQ